MGRILDGMGQIPVQRGKGDAMAMDRAIEELRAGECIGIFPEATRSKGRELRARSGFGRLAQAVPEATIVLVTVTGTVDVPRFPKRPGGPRRLLPPGGRARRPRRAPRRPPDPPARRDPRPRAAGRPGPPAEAGRAGVVGGLGERQPRWVGRAGSAVPCRRVLPLLEAKHAKCCRTPSPGGRRRGKAALVGTTCISSPRPKRDAR